MHTHGVLVSLGKKLCVVSGRIKKTFLPAFFFKPDFKIQWVQRGFFIQPKLEYWLVAQCRSPIESKPSFYCLISLTCIENEQCNW